MTKEWGKQRSYRFVRYQNKTKRKIVRRKEGDPVLDVMMTCRNWSALVFFFFFFVSQVLFLILNVRSRFIAFLWHWKLAILVLNAIIYEMFSWNGQSNLLKFWSVLFFNQISFFFLRKMVLENWYRIDMDVLKHPGFACLLFFFFKSFRSPGSWSVFASQGYSEMWTADELFMRCVWLRSINSAWR